ncbi:hypothetical protein CEUSTIGMA_g6303.t1 [Chlamydomonas eustigma]|uniref:Uncharacterized protein n=1 Tax=Chlamydomonas eustigma TaxID=1157962 RepID=A0A250X724_9CHLO|nr:hypothetical protein CEUSTIGMA_g6303.t1 [Chlamydomonas eustigma]|eukprot:GAX78865.1 hypothetical protein CEUSTIGMA_g6303.t1 [Chlamydomonas eustigma]
MDAVGVHGAGENTATPEQGMCAPSGLTATGGQQQQVEVVVDVLGGRVGGQKAAKVYTYICAACLLMANVACLKEEHDSKHGCPMLSHKHPSNSTLLDFKGAVLTKRKAELDALKGHAMKEMGAKGNSSDFSAWDYIAFLQRTSKIQTIKVLPKLQAELDRRQENKKA